MKLVAVGDLHLGAGPDLGANPGDRLDDQAAVLERIVEVVRAEKPELVLFAGDAFHRRRPTPAELHVFQRFALDLREAFAGDVVSIVGNHDLEGADRPSALELFRPELNVWRTSAVDFVTGVAVLPWSPTSRLVAARGGGDRDELNTEAAELLVAAAGELLEKIPVPYPRVLLTHFSIGGATTPTGAPTDLFREPVLDAHALAELGYDLVIAGHIHRPQSVGSGPTPILYVGSPMPLDFGEGGSPHGLYVVDVERGETPFARFVPIPSRRLLTVDLPPLAIADWIKGLTVHGDAVPAGAILRVRYDATREQARKVDNGKIGRAFVDAGASKVLVQPTILREDRARIDVGADETLEPLEALARWADTQELGPSKVGPLVELTTRYLEEIRA